MHNAIVVETSRHRLNTNTRLQRITSVIPLVQWQILLHMLRLYT